MHETTDAAGRAAAQTLYAAMLKPLGEACGPVGDLVVATAARACVRGDEPLGALFVRLMTAEAR